LAVRDPAEAAGSALGRAVTERVERGGGGLMGWAVAGDDVEAVARRLGTGLSRVRGQGFSARVTGVRGAMAERCLPFVFAVGAARAAGCAGSRRGAGGAGGRPGCRS